MNTKTLSRQVSEGHLSRGTPRWLAERSFRRGDIPAVRRFAGAFGARARMTPARLSDFVLAASEAAASATAQGPCTARVRLWAAGSRAYCEVRGDAMTGRRGGYPTLEEDAIRLWVLRRLADYVSVASGPDGAWVLLSMTVA